MMQPRTRQKKMAVSSRSSVNVDKESLGGPGRGRGLSYLKEIAKAKVRPPKAQLEEKGIKNYHAEKHDENQPISKFDDQTLEKSNENIVDKQSIITNTELVQAKADNNQGNEKDENYVEQKEKTVDEEQHSRKEDVQPIESGYKVHAKVDERLLKSVECQPFTPKQTFNVNAQEFVPSNKQVKNSVIENQKGVDDNQDSFLLGVYHDAVQLLSHRPDKFEGVIENLIETIQMFITQKETMEKIVHKLIEQAILEQNFLYSAVRLINTFMERLQISKEISFRTCFYKRLQNVHSDFQTLLKDHQNPESQSRASGLALLFADLLCNVKTPTGDLNIAFLNAVFKIIVHLQENPTEMMVITLVKVLKLTGPTLDEHKTQGKGIQEVDEMFNSFRDPASNKAWLAHLEKGASLSERIFGVYKLHTRNWDREPKSSDRTSQVATGTSSGQQASAFSQDYFSGTSDIDWNEFCGPEDFDQPEEYDDDFEQFLNETQQL